MMPICLMKLFKGRAWHFYSVLFTQCYQEDHESSIGVLHCRWMNSDLMILIAPTRPSHSWISPQLRNVWSSY